MRVKYNNNNNNNNNNKSVGIYRKQQERLNELLLVLLIYCPLFAFRGEDPQWLIYDILGMPPAF